MTAPLRHPLTSAQRNAQRQAQHRARVKAKLARLAVLEAALERAAEVMEWLAKYDPGCFGWLPPYPSDASGIAEEAGLARAALNHTTEAREEGA